MSNLQNLKVSAARAVGVTLYDCPGCNGELTSRQAGSIGGEMNRQLWQSYKAQQ